MTHPPVTDIDQILSAAADLIMHDGYNAVTFPAIAERSGAARDEVESLFDTPNDVLVSMLNREFSLMYASIVDHVDRDPRGGLLSRMYTYILSSVYERPLARTLFVIDRDALHQIMRNANGFVYMPNVGVRADLIENLQNVGMVRPDIDARMVSSVLSLCSAGLAITAPHDDLDMTIRAIADLLHRSVDADVADTSPGKGVFYEWATSLTLPKSSG
ncbi:MAG: TetR/AcrR family transcriptional regulator [Actinobacteria bacterium]|nr:TetR/AcrR family transcriptional regulator [Actinomycetota bacterium]MBU1609193.1 TetR/AcrR family transcriptional regulator [Actinomycetota bacterium]MBU2316796.1 TetR/AcrR family transcriptional regulator [Actinomycetota bacterium]MBU2386094.1 TetR/AcrR family transcriptional regulator [Actinomycetota bacterium]